MKSRTFFITIALVIILILLSVVHFIVYEGLVVGFGITNSETLKILRIIFSILTISFIVASLMSYRWSNLFTRIFYRFSAAWLGMLTYFFLAAFLCIGFAAIGPVSLFFSVASIFFAIAGFVGIYGLIHAEHIYSTYIRVELKNLPEALKNKKAVFVSDLHLGQVHGKAYVEKVIEKIEKIQPEIIFIGGDMYDGVAVDEKDVVSPFKKLKPNLGIYFVMGNHEEFGDNVKYKNALENAGIRILSDEVVDVSEIQIIGVDYKTTTTEEKFKSVLEKISLDTSKPSILLKHVPLHVGLAAEKGISLQLSGHSHKAQIFPFSLLTKSIFKGFDYGLKSFKNMHVYTSSGVGTWGPPLRVGTKSEIVVITF